MNAEAKDIAGDGETKQAIMQRALTVYPTVLFLLMHHYRNNGWAYTRKLSLEQRTVALDERLYVLSVYYDRETIAVLASFPEYVKIRQSAPRRPTRGQTPQDANDQEHWGWRFRMICIRKYSLFIKRFCILNAILAVEQHKHVLEAVFAENHEYWASVWAQSRPDESSANVPLPQTLSPISEEASAVPCSYQCRPHRVSMFLPRIEVSDDRNFRTIQSSHECMCSCIACAANAFALANPRRCSLIPPAISVTADLVRNATMPEHLALPSQDSGGAMVALTLLNEGVDLVT